MTLVIRVCGICSHVHTTAYCQGVETLLGLDVPLRALYLRALLSELERLRPAELLVSEGEHVKAGQTIAKMGNSGTDRTQLYFEIRKDGKPVNPLRYLPKA